MCKKAPNGRRISIQLDRLANAPRPGSDENIVVQKESMPFPKCSVLPLLFGALSVDKPSVFLNPRWAAMVPLPFFRNEAFQC